MNWCSCCCKADVVVDAHHAVPYVNGEEKQQDRVDDEEAVEKDLYYFDAMDNEEEEVEEEEEDFFDTVSENIRGELATLLRGETVDDDMLLDSYHRAPSLLASSTGRNRRGVSVKSEEWGFPGSLTPRQLDAYQEFRAEVHRRGGVYREMVYCYNEIEPEPYALCRFLRNANFNPNRAFKYMDEHVEDWQEAKKKNFYPDANVGCPLSVLLTQFPSLYAGFAKDGFPVCYFHSGSLSIEGIECVTDLDRLPYFIWYTMMHDIRKIYAEAIARNPSLGRCVVLLDYLLSPVLCFFSHTVCY